MRQVVNQRGLDREARVCRQPLFPFRECAGRLDMSREIFQCNIGRLGDDWALCPQARSAAVRLSRVVPHTARLSAAARRASRPDAFNPAANAGAARRSRTAPGVAPRKSFRPSSVPRRCWTSAATSSGREAFGALLERVAIERSAFAETFELQIHHAGDARIVAAKPMRIPRPEHLPAKRSASAGWPAMPVRLRAVDGSRCRNGVRPGAHITTRFPTRTAGVHRLQRQRHVGRHFDAELSLRQPARCRVRRFHGRRGQDARVRRACGQRHRSEHANGTNAFQSALVLVVKRASWRQQKTRRPGRFARVRST